jgi:hypothetical protein
LFAYPALGFLLAFVRMVANVATMWNGPNGGKGCLRLWTPLKRSLKSLRSEDFLDTPRFALGIASP